MSTTRVSSRARRWGWSVAAVLAVLGAATITVATLAQQHAPQPSAAAAIPRTTTAAPTGVPATGAGAPATGSPPPTSAGPILPSSPPVSVAVPAIGVRSNLLTLGLNPDNTVEVPPLGPVSQAGWFDRSPTPGQLGPAVLLGHIDSAQYGPGVFFRLGALVPGDPIEVTRSDHTVAVFEVDRVVSYPKDAFPSLEVYGNTRNAQLRLITCGGVFDRAARSYESNIVVYASLVASRPA